VLTARYAYRRVRQESKHLSILQNEKQVENIQQAKSARRIARGRWQQYFKNSYFTCKIIF